MGVGDDFDARARHDEIGNQGGAIRIGLGKIAAIDRIHALEVLRVRHIDKDLRDVGERPTGSLNRALQVGQGQFGLGANIAGVKAAIGFQRELCRVECRRR